MTEVPIADLAPRRSRIGGVQFFGDRDAVDPRYVALIAAR
jgi:hypothetical protein